MALNTLSCNITSLDALSNISFGVIGTGGYVDNLVYNLKILLPKRKIRIYHTSGEMKVIQGIESNPIDKITEKNLVLGSDVYQYEIMMRVNDLGFFDINFLDVSSDVNGFFQEYLSPIEGAYVLFFTTSPSHHLQWMSGIEAKLAFHGIKIVVRHPLQNVKEEHLKNAKAIFLWNGTVSSFNVLKNRLSELSIPYDFVECGFFPQKDYLYLDKQGINAQSQLKCDDLSWLPIDYEEKLNSFRNDYFLYTEENNDNGYIFIPLQLESDSNVQVNSRFKNGMQEFIEYIESLYPSDRVIFKAHPLDRHKDNYTVQHGEWSNLDSLSLIKNAIKVHGINSTVLFEAALFGVPVVAEGSCLLNLFLGREKALLAAMLYRQFPVETGPNSEFCYKFTHFSSLFNKRAYVIS